jgi:hypothetical protein
MDEALSKLRNGDWHSGLSLLNELWAKTHCEELARLIERLSVHALSAREPLVGERAALQTAWEERWAMGDAVGVEHLYSVICQGNASNLRARLERLCEGGPDPRLFMVVQLFANDLHHSAKTSRIMWNAFFKLVVQNGDPRARPVLERLLALAQERIDAGRYFDVTAHYLEYLSKKIPETLSQLPKASRYERLEELENEIDSLIAQPFVEVSSRANLLAELYEQVLEKPEDEAAIQVWGDALLEAGDERGEFVALQLAAERRPLSAAETKEHNRLYKDNRLKWLGQAGAAIEVHTAVFRRGLLDSARLKERATAEQLNAPEFRSASELRGPEWRPDQRHFISHPNLVSLDVNKWISRLLFPPHGTQRHALATLRELWRERLAAKDHQDVSRLLRKTINAPELQSQLEAFLAELVDKN